MLNEVADDIEDHYTTSKDTDARVGHKSEYDSFFGYKTHIAMSENVSLQPPLSLQARKVTVYSWKSLWNRGERTGWRLERLCGDTAYSGKDNIILSQDEEKGFELVAHHDQSWLQEGRRQVRFQQGCWNICLSVRSYGRKKSMPREKEPRGQPYNGLFF